MWVYPGYASSSVVDTTATFALRIASNSGITFLSDDDVQCTTTSGFAAFSARGASPSTRTPRRRPSSMTSPTSRPTIEGSGSTAPTILNPGRLAS